MKIYEIAAISNNATIAVIKFYLLIKQEDQNIFQNTVQTAKLTLRIGQGQI